MTVDINKKRIISAKSDEEEEKQKLHHISISQSINKRSRIYAKDEEEKYTQQYLSNMFPHDIMLNILSRLPVKTLMQFRSVSRSWNYLIKKDELFINMHLSRSKLLQHEKIILMDNEWCNHSLYSLDYNQGSNGLERLVHHSSRLRHIYREHYFIWGSCNGLICTGSRTCYEQNLYISNPSTTEYRKLPYFKATPSDTCYGFGYNSITNDYVVVQLTGLKLRTQQFRSVVSVYSLRNHSWKKIQNIPYEAAGAFRPGELVNGSLHWVAHSKFIKKVYFRDEFDMAENAILAFEITTEKFVEVPCPDDHHGFDMIVGQYQGKLCFYHDKHINCNFDLWVMNEYKVRESWTKLFNIRKPGELVHTCIDYIVLCSTKEGSIYMRSCIFSEERLILYDPKRRTHRSILGIRIMGEVNTYVPSIVSV